MAQRTCTLCNCWVSLIDIDKHYEEHHSNERNEWPILSGRYHNTTISSDDDDDDELNSSSDYQPQQSLHNSLPLQSSFSTQFELFLAHQKSAKDTESYPIAWYGKPFHLNANFVIRTLWSHHNQLCTESVYQMIQKYPDLKEKILNSEFKYMLNTNNNLKNQANNNNYNNLESLDWKQKALQIIHFLEKEETSKPFRQRVDETRDSAPKYYQTIKEPMDLYTLKSLINNNKISSAKKFVSNLMLIWENAQSFNQQSHEIYQYALKLRTKSNKLIKKYWPNEYKNLYESRRRSKRLKKNQENKKIAIVKYSDDNKCKIRKCLLCGICSQPLRFMCGFHVNCVTLLPTDNVIKSEHENSESLHVQMEEMPQCNECKMEINDITIWYYHCISGCSENQQVEEESDDDLTKYHSVFLCEICAEKHYDSQQVKINNNLAFYGCFLDITLNGGDLWYEAIRFESDANRIYYQLIFSSETHKRHITEAVICDNHNNNNKMFQVTQTHIKKTQFTKGILSEDGLSLTFIDKDEENINPTDPNALIFKKVRIFCKKCGKETSFMSSHTFPSSDISSPIWCDTHPLYHGKQKLLSREQRCISFSLLDEKYSEEIYKQDFYFSCIACNDFDQCAICVLIQHEIEFKANVIDNDYYEPSHKKQRLDNTVYIDGNHNKLSQIYHDEGMSNNCRKRARDESYDDCNPIHKEYEKLKEMYIFVKRKNQELNDTNGRITILNDKLRSELDIARLQNESLIMKINAQIAKITSEKNQCIQSFNQLKQNVISAFNSCGINKME